MLARVGLPLTPQEYLAIEREADFKSEYLGREMYAMAGAGGRHNRIAASLAAELYLQVKDRPCAVYPSDQRVTIPSKDLYTYPDVTVVCGDAEFEDEREDTLLNPTVIFEVLSKSTEAYDRGAKFEYYRTVASLKEYILVAPDKAHVEHYLRQPNGTWILSEFKRLDETVQLPSIGCALDLKDIYRKVSL